MRLAATVAVWKRHDLTRFTLSRLVRQIKAVSDNALIQVVGSEGTISKNLAEACGAEYVEIPNMPLNRKLNAGSLALQTFNPDFVFSCGSDTLFSDNFFSEVIAKTNGRIFCGVRDFYSYSFSKKLFGYWGGYGPTNKRFHEPVGTGRCFNKEIMDLCEWQLWNPDSHISRGLDYNCSKYLSKFGIGYNSYSMAELGVCVVEVKTDVNIWPWDKIVYRQVISSKQIDSSVFINTGLRDLMTGNTIKVRERR